MNARELREALGEFEEPNLADFGPPFDKLLARMWVVEQAARTIALPILEADPELVERVRGVFDAKLRAPLSDTYTGAGIGIVIDTLTRDVLAAISTPTPGAE